MCPRVWEFAGGGEESIPEDAASAYAPQSVPRTRALNPGSRPAPAPCLHPAPSESVHPSRVDGQGLISAPRFETRGAGARAARGARLPRVWGRRGRRPEGARRGGGAAGPRRFPGRGRGGEGRGRGGGGRRRGRGGLKSARAPPPTARPGPRARCGRRAIHTPSGHSARRGGGGRRFNGDFAARRRGRGRGPAAGAARCYAVAAGPAARARRPHYAGNAV